MIPLTTTDANAGYLIIGAVIGLIGAGLIWFGRSAYAEHLARKAERIMGLDSQATTHQFADSLTGGEDEYAEHHWSEAMERDCAQSLAIAKHNVDALDKVSSLPGRRLASVPVQGKPSGWS